MKRFGLFVTVGMGVGGAAFGQINTAALDAAAAEHGLMGMSVAAQCPGGPVATYHMGWRDFGRELPVNDATRYRVASVSKAVTALGCAVLVEEGLLGWDEDVSEVLGYTLRHPGHPDVAITLRLLMSHRAGLRDGSGYSPFLTATYTGAPDVPNLAELVVPGGAEYTADMWDGQAPGAWFQYANVNFGVVATVMEAAAGERFDQLMQDRVFAPLGLTCSFNVQLLPDIDDVAVLYRNQGGWVAQTDHYLGTYPPAPDLSGYTPGTNGLFFAPQGGLRASAVDLVRLYDVLADGGGLVAPATAEALRAEVWSANGANGNDYYGLFSSWGLGIHRANTGPDDALFSGFGPLVGHPGEAYGLISDAYLEPTSGWRFAFLTNGAWSGYPLGSTAWYAVEEAVFAALAADLAGCAASAVPSVSPLPTAAHPVLAPNPARPGTPLLLGSSPAAGLLHFARPDGATAATSADGTVPDLAPGLYLVSAPGLPAPTRLVVAPER